MGPSKTVSAGSAGGGGEGAASITISASSLSNSVSAPATRLTPASPGESTTGFCGAGAAACSASTSAAGRAWREASASALSALIFWRTAFISRRASARTELRMSRRSVSTSARRRSICRVTSSACSRSRSACSRACPSRRGLCLYFGQHRLHLLGFLADQSPGLVDNLPGQSQPLGNGKRIGRAGQSNPQVKGRGQTVKIKFHAGIGHARAWCGRKLSTRNNGSPQTW